MKKMSGASVAYLGFVFLLLGFISLGLFVVASALRSPQAVLIGVAAVVAFAVGATGFRVGNPWPKTMTAADLERYQTRYRGRGPVARPAELPRDGPHRRHRARRPVPLVHGRYRATHGAVRAAQPRLRRAH